MASAPTTEDRSAAASHDSKEVEHAGPSDRLPLEGPRCAREETWKVPCKWEGESNQGDTGSTGGVDPDAQHCSGACQQEEGASRLSTLHGSVHGVQARLIGCFPTLCRPPNEHYDMVGDYHIGIEFEVKWDEDGMARCPICPIGPGFHTYHDLALHQMGSTHLYWLKNKW